VISDRFPDATEAIAISFAHSRCAGYYGVPRWQQRPLNAGRFGAGVGGHSILHPTVRQMLDAHALSHLAANFDGSNGGGGYRRSCACSIREVGEPGRHGVVLAFRDLDRAATIADRFHLQHTHRLHLRAPAQPGYPLPPDTIADDGTFSLRAFFGATGMIFDPGPRLRLSRRLRRRSFPPVRSWQVSGTLRSPAACCVTSADRSAFSLSFLQIRDASCCPGRFC